MANASSPTDTSRAWRVLPVVIVFGLAAFVAGTRFIATRPAPPRHPITGRQIAGIATDKNWMDRAAREQEEAPDRALDLIGIQPGMTVADVGAGSGYMTMRIAQRVGASGKVYANDVQPAMLQVIREKAQQQASTNIEAVQGTDTDARLPDNGIDLALLVDVYHEFMHPQDMLRSIRRALRTDGRLVLIEYRKEDPNIPIAPTHRMSVADARAEIEAEGFVFDRVMTELPRQHIIVFRKR